MRSVVFWSYIHFINPLGGPEVPATHGSHFGNGVAPAEKAGIGGAEDDMLNLTTTAFKASGKIPKRHTCDGEGVSPALAWSGAPDGTRAFALIMDDPDAPAGTWVHWVLYDLPPATKGLPEGLAGDPEVAGGGRHGLCWGVDEFERVGYHGPCPPPKDAPHRYSFRLYALKAPLGLKARATKFQVVEAMKGKVLAEAELIGRYGR
jgi:Raf kinase inhibitor-like YbhB/YbcL family protein